MRIISGKHRSRRLQSPPEGAETRPVPDRVKESLFNLLRGHFEDAVVVDLFAGTGSFGLEAVSRGASRVTFVEQDRNMAGVLQENIDALGEHTTCQVMIGDALGPVTLARLRGPIDIVYMDPPYPMTFETEGWQRIHTQAERLAAMLSDDGFLMLRTPWPFVRKPVGGGSPTEIDLSLATADGPETHVYRQMAVHLYAKHTSPAREDAREQP